MHPGKRNDRFYTRITDTGAKWMDANYIWYTTLIIYSIESLRTPAEEYILFPNVMFGKIVRFVSTINVNSILQPRERKREREKTLKWRIQ